MGYPVIFNEILISQDMGIGPFHKKSSVT